MPRARDLGITIGVLPTGPTNSVLDVTGVGLGHTTLVRDEPAPPQGRGRARTGVTVLLLAEDAFRRPLAAGGAVLNGAGECTGFITAAEWGTVETPIYLTSTLQLAHALDLTLVAEGAEDQATVDALASLGCDVVQGYHLSRPLPAEQLWAWLQDRPPATVRSVAGPAILA